MWYHVVLPGGVSEATDSVEQIASQVPCGEHFDPN